MKKIRAKPFATITVMVRERSVQVATPRVRVKGRGTKNSVQVSINDETATPEEEEAADTTVGRGAVVEVTVVTTKVEVSMAVVVVVDTVVLTVDTTNPAANLTTPTRTEEIVPAAAVVDTIPTLTEGIAVAGTKVVAAVATEATITTTLTAAPVVEDTVIKAGGTTNIKIKTRKTNGAQVARGAVATTIVIKIAGVIAEVAATAINFWVT